MNQKKKKKKEEEETDRMRGSSREIREGEICNGLLVEEDGAVAR
jgi:hypothetical protein